MRRHLIIGLLTAVVIATITTIILSNGKTPPLLTLILTLPAMPLMFALAPLMDNSQIGTRDCLEVVVPVIVSAAVWGFIAGFLTRFLTRYISNRRKNSA